MARLKKYASVRPEDGSSRLNANEEKKLAWMPFQEQKKEKKEGLKQTLNNQRKYQNYRIGGGEKTFEEWKKTQ